MSRCRATYYRKGLHTSTSGSCAILEPKASDGMTLAVGRYRINYGRIIRVSLFLLESEGSTWAVHDSMFKT